MTPKPTLRLGSSGAAVTELQHRLNVIRGPNIALLVADGAFGGKTLGAVKAFQTQAKLVADGIVGPKTWGALVVKTLNDTTAIAAQILGSAAAAPMPMSLLIAAAMTAAAVSGKRS